MTEAAQQMATLLREKKQTITCAESCTGGLLMNTITDIPGSSAIFIGGVVAYSNAMKHVLLGVPEHMLENFGAVSEEVAAAMARGVRGIVGANLALAVTGIAGPGGATADKPVGLTYISLTGADIAITKRFVWDGDREANKRASVDAALEIVLQYLDSVP